MKPHQESKSPKKNQVEKMFDSISFEYDLLNAIMTFNSHKRWKKNILNIAKKLKPKNALDIATGTADIAINLGSISNCEVIGVDISEQMLNVGREKITKMKLTKSVRLESGDAENLNFKDNYFDLVTIWFGVRNFQDLEKGLSESLRVLKVKGTLIVLETSVPENRIMKLFLAGQLVQRQMQRGCAGAHKKGKGGIMIIFRVTPSAELIEQMYLIWLH